MKNIPISKKLKLPLDAVTQTFGIIARKGAGKTYLAMLLAEGLLDVGAQVVILDPVGNWWSLRLLADGKRSGFDIPVLGGFHGDVPLEPEAGELVADLVCEGSLSAVLDVSEFSQAGRKRFVTAFARRLFANKKRERSPIHFMMEEAQLFCPQRVDSKDSGMVGAIEHIVRLGRNYGIGSTMISQRPQSINKEVLNQVECLFVLQTSGAHERKAIKEWVDNNATDTRAAIGDLPGLQVGEAMVWSPQWLRIFEKHKINKKRSFDGSATPVMGGKVVTPRRLAKKEIQSLEQSMGDIIQKKRDNDPEILKREVARLSRLADQAPDPEAAKKLREYQADADKRIRALEKQTQDNQKRLEKCLEKVAATFQKLGAGIEELQKLAQANPLDVSIPPAPVLENKINPPLQITPKSVLVDKKFNGGDPEDLKPGELAMIKVLVQRYPLAYTLTQLSTLSGRSKKSSAFRPTYQALIERGLAALDPMARSRIGATQKAVEMYSSLEPVPTDRESLLKYWRDRFTPSAGRILEVVVNEFGREWRSYERLAELAEVSLTSSAFMTHIRDLSNNGLIEVDRPDRLVRAADSFFM